jgi:hypothetical protein
MKKITIGLLVTILTFISFDGWAQSSSADTSTGVDDTFFNISQKVRSQMHELTNECMKDVTQIPSDQKIKWCQEVNQALIARQEQRNNRQAILMYKQNLAECKDAACQQQNKMMIDQLQQNNDDQMDQLKSNLDRCQYIADSMLIDKCKRIESSTNNLSIERNF